MPTVLCAATDTGMRQCVDLTFTRPMFCMLASTGSHFQDCSAASCVPLSARHIARTTFFRERAIMHKPPAPSTRINPPVGASISTACVLCAEGFGWQGYVPRFFPSPFLPSVSMQLPVTTFIKARLRLAVFTTGTIKSCTTFSRYQEKGLHWSFSRSSMRFETEPTDTPAGNGDMTSTKSLKLSIQTSAARRLFRTISSIGTA
mmetsp:Transcript_24658/g.57252  ORF Transcript_24658/g.57252 Transcript_24658/m.57252 type:complete len:203 (+) Transcript_24658:192-800(+)